MNQSYESNAWSLYWAEDRLYSCVAQSSDEDQKYLNKLWQAFATSLDENSRVLDLATGNGAVANAVLSSNDSLQIDAVDKASIDPKKFVKSHRNLESVNFHSDTNIFEMPFGSSQFDAITSQFGIEYAGLEQASMHVIDLLNAGGRFQFVVHHAESGIVLSSKHKIVELEQLTQPSGVLETLIEVLGGRAEFAQLEAVGQSYLTQDFVRSQQVSGQVFAGIERIINNFSTQPRESLELGVAMDLRVRSELTRLRQLIAASQTAQAMSQWVESLTSIGMHAEFKPLFLDTSEQDYLIAWLANGRRPE